MRQPPSVCVAHGTKLISQCSIILGVAKGSQHLLLIILHQVDAEIGFGWKMIVHAGALDPNVRGKVAKAEPVETVATYPCLG
jgi:hypothetical protein